MLASKPWPLMTLVTGLPDAARNSAAWPAELPTPAITIGDPAQRRAPISVFVPLGRYLRQIALIFYFEELSESSRKLDTNVLYLTQGDSFSEYPDYDASMQRRVW